jgi:S1-C subfamily serine protease
MAAREGGKTVRRPWLGATLQNVSNDIAENLGMTRPMGGLVVDVEADGPAAQAGLKRGDVIASIDGTTLDDAQSVGFRLGVKPLGGVSKLGIVRDGKPLDLTMKLVAAPEVPPRDALTIKSHSPFEGAEVMNVSPAVIEELSLDAHGKGVVVASVRENSTAGMVGLQKGDIILAVNSQQIATTRDLEKACAERARWWDLTIQRAGQTIRTQISG